MMLLWPGDQSAKGTTEVVAGLPTAIRELLLSDDDVWLVDLQGGNKGILLLMKGLFGFPHVESLVIHVDPQSGLCRSLEELVALGAGNVGVILGGDNHQPQPLLRQAHKPLQPIDRMPFVPDAPLQEAHQGREAGEGTKDREDAADAVAAQHLGEGAEAGDEHDAAKFYTLGGVMLRDAASDCRAEALAEKDDAIGRDTGGLDDKVDDRGGILDESMLGGRAGGVAIASVVNGEDVVRRGVSQGVVAVWATALGDVACVLHTMSAMIL
jgi:hypothetical protein